jgi:hypothetical protein
VTFEEKSAIMVRYFERLEEVESGDWSRQLLVAQMWQILLQNNSKVSKNEFLKLVEGGSEDLGSGFIELVYWIKRWAIEN